ncbi:MAG TPA: universal stress protein [Stellaceae bacterium]|jgi:nucleotide-binding universal stress UspA family protein
MIKTILVPATGSKGDGAVFVAALAVARRFEAHLDVLHVRADATAMAVAMTTDAGGPPTLGGLIDRLDADAAEREEAARREFDAFCMRERLAVAEAPPEISGPSARWVREVGLEPYWITEYGRVADLIVAGRPEDGEGLASDTLEAALLDSGRPLLIPPPALMSALPESVVIAWKPKREAARAIAAAMPFLVAAKEVVVLTADESAEDAGEEETRLPASLRWHGIAASARHLPADGRSAADRLMAAAGEHNALLVMGGYGHSRLREWMFGGFTRHVLEAAAVPVLIAH